MPATAAGPRRSLPLRRDLIPSSAIPIAYFAFAHAGLALALAVVAARPQIAAGFFYHPKMLALVHLVTLAWLTGSILGAFYIVAPLALRMPFPAGAGDWVGFLAFAVGTSGMVARLWLEDRDGAAAFAILVLAAVAWVALRASRRLRAAPVPWPVKLHVGLAFGNILAAGAFGILIAIDRSRGFLGIPPLASVYAHAHLAAVGWVLMMVIGLSYRLIPMMLPAHPPHGASLASSAVAIESGLAILLYAFTTGSGGLTAGAGLIAVGIGCFVWQIRRTLASRVVRPPALPGRDWSVWQTHAALLWLIVAVALGLVVTTGLPGTRQVQWIWVYGVAGLIGFLAQIVTGMQGRLVPLYAWYRTFAASGGEPPARAANEIPSAAFARPLFLLWTAAVPLLAWGLAREHRAVISIASGMLCCAVLLGALYIRVLLRAPGDPVARS
jgi:hypothetical protein